MSKKCYICSSRLMKQEAHHLRRLSGIRERREPLNKVAYIAVRTRLLHRGDEADDYQSSLAVTEELQRTFRIRHQASGALRSLMHQGSVVDQFQRDSLRSFLGLSQARVRARLVASHALENPQMLNWVAHEHQILQRLDAPLQCLRQAVQSENQRKPRNSSSYEQALRCCPGYVT